MHSDISTMNQLTQTWNKRLRLNRICQFNIFSLPIIIDRYDKFLTGLDVLMSFCWAPFQQIVSWSAYSIPLPRTIFLYHHTPLYYIERKKNKTNTLETRIFDLFDNMIQVFSLFISRPVTRNHCMLISWRSSTPQREWNSD